jgi:Ca2+-binding RTX toxin-like protein
MTRRTLTLVGSAALMLALIAGIAWAITLDCDDPNSNPNADQNQCFGTPNPDVLDAFGATEAFLIDAGASADAVNGGGGNDTMFGRKGPDGPADTTLGADSFDGNSGNDSMDGGPGNDLQVDGDSDDDTIQGGDGNDGVRDSAGNCDFGFNGGSGVRGEDGENIVGGGAGDDCIDADTDAGDDGEAEEVFGGTGNDFIVAEDGVEDTISCGGGFDIVFADDPSIDSVAANCESVNPSGAQSISSLSAAADENQGDDAS